MEKALELVGLSREAGHKLKGYSGGMKRRVGIAQVLVNDPKLLIGLASQRKAILSTHIVEDAGQTCQDLAVPARTVVTPRRRWRSYL